MTVWELFSLCILANFPFPIVPAAAAAGAGGEGLQLETGDFLLKEDGDNILLE